MTQPSSATPLPVESPVGQAALSDGDRPISVLLQDLVEHTQDLAKQELALASAQLDQKIQEAKAALIAPLLGIGVACAGALAVVAALILLLAQALPAWIAALIVGAVCGAIGLFLVKRATAVDPRFRRTETNIKADIHTIKDPIK